MKNKEDNPKYKIDKTLPTDDGFSDKYSTYKHLIEVKSDIRDNITSDFILAKLNDNQKESVVELVRDAYFAKKEIEKLARGYTYRIDKNRKYYRNEDYSYKKFELSQDEKDYIKMVARMTFNSYMIKLIMTVIMYRNIDKNVVMELITEKDRLMGENEELSREKDTLLGKAKNKLKNEEKD